MITMLVAAGAVHRCDAYYVPLNQRQTTAIHLSARRAIHHSADEQALSLYKSATAHGNDARSYLLLALHHQRMGKLSRRPTAVDRAPPEITNYHRDAARNAFNAGLALRSGNAVIEAEILQAWALLESKCGNMHRAVLLLRRSAQLNPSRVIQAFNWKLFRV